MENKGSALPVGRPNSPMGHGARGELIGIPWVMADWLPQITVRYPTRETDEEESTILRRTLVLSLWPIMSSPILCHVDTVGPLLKGE